MSDPTWRTKNVKMIPFI